jgi:hypothetical protein
MAIPETPTAATPSTLKRRRSPVQAWTIFAQFMSIMCILASLVFALYVSVSVNGVIGGTLSGLEVSLYLPALLFIPLIIARVIGKKHNMVALILSIVTFFLAACGGSILFMLPYMF